MKHKFTYTIPYLFFIAFIVMIVFESCEKDSTILIPTITSKDTSVQYVFRGLRGMMIWKIRESKNYIYACAGRDGLYRSSKTAIDSASWHYLGLKTNESGPQGVMDVAVIGNNDSIICAGLGNNKKDLPGLMRSTNAGFTWQRSDSNLIGGWELGATKIHSAIYFAVNEINPQLIYTFNSFNSAVYWSHDAGEHWSRTNNPSIRYDGINDVAIDHNDPKSIWAGGYAQYSSDNGVTWSFVYSLARDVGYTSVWRINFGKPNEVFLLVGRQIAHSTNNGENWTTSLSVVDSLFIGAMVVMPDQEDRKLVSVNEVAAKSKKTYLHDIRNGNIEHIYPINEAIQTMTLTNDKRLLLGMIKGGIYELTNITRE